MYVDSKDKVFLQVLIYDESTRDLYENTGKKYSDFQKSKLKDSTPVYDRLIFVPYKAIGDFEFNCSLTDIIKNMIYQKCYSKNEKYHRDK